MISCRCPLLCIEFFYTDFSTMAFFIADIYHLLGDESHEIEGAQLHHLYTTQLLQGTFDSLIATKLGHALFSSLPVNIL